MNSSSGRLEEKHGGKVTFGGGFFVPHVRRAGAAGEVFRRASRVLLAGQGQAAEGASAALLHQSGRDPHLHRGGSARRCGRSRDATVFSVSQNDWDNHCECPQLPGAGQAGRLADGAGAATGQPRGRGGGEGVSRQDRGDAGLPVDAPAAEAHAAAAERGHPALLDRVLLLAIRWPPATARRTGRSAPTWRPGPRSPRGSGCGTTSPISRNYLLPFPNQRVRGPNIRFFVAHNVKGIFEQDTYDTRRQRALAPWADT